MRSLIGIFLFTTLFASAQTNADDIVKTWYNTKKTAKIMIYKNGQHYDGKIVWLKEPKNEQGTEKLDKNNPNDHLKKRPIMGLVLLVSFKYKGKGEYVGGEIYDPENGKHYSCKMTLKDPSHLDVRGFIGFSLLGRTENWTLAN